MTKKVHKAPAIVVNSSMPNILCDEMLDDAAFAARDEAWAAMVELFDDLAERDEISYKTLAERINRSRSQVHRWLNSSSNVTLKSLGLIATGMNADVQIKLCPVTQPEYGQNECHPADSAAASIEFDNWSIRQYDGTTKRVQSAHKIVTKSSSHEAAL